MLIKGLVLLGARLLVLPARSDTKPQAPDPADCFCSNNARDLSLGHFVDGGVTFVVDVPLTPGPGDVMRAAGDRIAVGLAPVSTGFALLADFARQDET